MTRFHNRLNVPDGRLSTRKSLAVENGKSVLLDK